LAVAKPELEEKIWSDPVWPDPLPEPASLRLLYAAEADELVVLFDDQRYPAVYFDFIGTLDEDYAAIKINMRSGDVIGVLVYPLAALAVERHPAWRPALAPNPPQAVANRIVMDIKDLYDRCGLIPELAGPH